jgi:YfiR/HmsC-like
MRTVSPTAKTAVRFPTRRAWLQAAAVTAIGGVVRRAHAADVSVPVSLQTALIGKIAAFDRAFQARSGSTARLIVTHKGGDSARIGHQIASALGEMRDIAGLPKTVDTLEWNSPAALASTVRTRPTALVYFSVGLEAEGAEIAAALAGSDVLTVGATGLIAERGACVGFELEEGKPRIYVNLRVAKAQKVDFRAELLRLVKLV